MIVLYENSHYGLEYSRISIVDRIWNDKNGYPEEVYLGHIDVNGHTLWTLYIREEYRKNGLATTLLTLAESYVRSNGFIQTWLYCWETKLQFYLNRGWTIDQKIMCGRNEVKYALTKNLY